MDLETFLVQLVSVLRVKLLLCEVVIESNHKGKNVFLNFWTNFPKM